MTIRRSSQAHYSVPLSIAFAELTTHNRFALDRGGKVFKQTAPVIKLASAATEDQYLALLGVLNSSAACFWIKQVFQNKGSSVDQNGARQTSVAFENYWQLDATKLKRFPLPSHPPTPLARKLDDIARHLQAHSPRCLLEGRRFWNDPLSVSINESFATRERAWNISRKRMIALQEELDWECYRLYGLIEEELTKAAKPQRDTARIWTRSFLLCRRLNSDSGLSRL